MNINFFRYKYVDSQAVQEASQKKLPFIYQEEQEEASPFYFQCCSEVLPSPKEARILLKLGENINEVEPRNSKVVKDNFTLQKQAEEVNS